MRKPVETRICRVDVFVDVQDNGDGTWTAVIPAFNSLPCTAETRDRAIADVARSVSVRALSETLQEIFF